VRVRTYGFPGSFTRPPGTSTRHHPYEPTASKPVVPVGCCPSIVAQARYSSVARSRIPAGPIPYSIGTLGRSTRIGAERFDLTLLDTPGNAPDPAPLTTGRRYYRQRRRRTCTRNDAAPGRLRNLSRPARRPFGSGGAASHLSGLALCGSVPRPIQLSSLPHRLQPPGDSLPASCEKNVSDLVPALL
jgi:hypothetical protein